MSRSGRWDGPGGVSRRLNIGEAAGEAEIDRLIQIVAQRALHGVFLVEIVGHIIALEGNRTGQRLASGPVGLQTVEAKRLEKTNALVA